jgi:ferritin-like metal-binding protein YciE
LQTQEQVKRLEQVFDSIGLKPKGKTCPAILGILEEGTEIMEEYAGLPVLDAALISAAQAVEHYEIARYGTLKCWAEKLGISDAVQLLDETLQEEGQTDVDLTELANNDANTVAIGAAA